MPDYTRQVRFVSNADVTARVNAARYRLTWMSNRSGITLLELLIVVLIVSISALALLPAFGTFSADTRLIGAAGALVDALYFAKNQALNYQRPFGVQLDTTQNWFRVYDQRYQSDPAEHYDQDPPVAAYGVVLNPNDKAAYQLDFDQSPEFKGVAIDSVPAAAEVCFYPDGHTGLTDSTIAIGYGGRQVSVIIAGFTGDITVE